MNSELYNLVISNLRCYYSYTKKLNEIKDEAYGIKGRQLDENMTSTKGIAGNAKYQNKVNEYIELENLIKENFNEVTKALSFFDDDISQAIIKGIAENKYVPCKTTNRHMIELTERILKDIAIRLVGEELYSVMNKN